MKTRKVAVAKSTRPTNINKRVSMVPPPSPVDDADHDHPPSNHPNNNMLGPHRTVRLGCVQTTVHNSIRAVAQMNYSDDKDDNYMGVHEKTNGDTFGDSSPGAGWTNGAIAIPPQSSLYPYTRPGRLAVYTRHRRMINFATSWSRIGEGTTEFGLGDHSNSAKGQSIMSGDPREEGRMVRALVAQLCERFYGQGWATGTGGGVSIRVGGPTENRPYRVFVAPSGVMKEDMVGDDIFELDMDMTVIRPAPDAQSTTQCMHSVVVYGVPTSTAGHVCHTYAFNACPVGHIARPD